MRATPLADAGGTAPRVAWVGPEERALANAFARGVHRALPGAVVLDESSRSIPARCKEAALAAIARGAMVVMAHGGLCAEAALAGARQQNVPGLQLGDFEFPDVVADLLARDAAAGVFHGGEDIFFGAASGAIGVGALDPRISPDTVVRARTAAQNLRVGSRERLRRRPREPASLHDELDQDPVAGVSPTPQQHFAWRFSGLRGVLTPVITTLIAFLMGGLVVALTGKSPFKVYHAIFTGTGIGWFFQVGNYSARIPFATSHMWFPWDTGSVAASNLQQTLLFTTPIILTALAVAFAFRCGMFNIGGQGQYIAGTDLRRLARLVVRLARPVAPRAPVPRRRDARGRRVGRDRRDPEGDGRGARGDLDDHAQLDRDLGRLLPVRPRRPVAGRAGVDPGLEHDRRRGEAPGLLGPEAAAGPVDRDLHRPRDARRLLDRS